MARAYDSLHEYQMNPIGCLDELAKQDTSKACVLFSLGSTAAASLFKLR
jgi:hypothetical protein